MMKIDPGAIGFTSGFSREHKYSTVGEQITVKQLTELSIVMRISSYDHIYKPKNVFLQFIYIYLILHFYLSSISISIRSHSC